MRIEQIIKSDNLPEGRKAAIHLIYTANLVQERTADILKPYGISIPQFNVLRILRGQKGKPANLSTIQDRMLTKMSNTTRIVDKLIEKQLVERIICEKNRRKVEISITPRGLELLSETDAPIDAFNELLIKNFNSDELALFNELLEKLRTHN